MNIDFIFPCKSENTLFIREKICFACRRQYKTEKTFSHKKLEKTFCDIKIGPKLSKKCEKCNVFLYSDHCAKGHKKICSYFGWKCNKCNKYTHKGFKE